MRFARKATILVGIVALTSAILYATGNLVNVRYNPVNNADGEMAAEPSDEISVRDNATFAVKLPDKMSFAGEPVPLDEMDVRERFDRELTVNSYWHSSTILMMKRAYRWFPTIEQILRKNNVPEDFKYLAMAESGLQDVVSSAGATGFWQFMRSAGLEQGLTINSEVDERYHVEKSTEAACRYLKSLKEEFGSWTLAAAAYNMGRTGLMRQLERQEERNYYDLILNDETSRYVFRILALKSIYTAPLDFGFQLTTSDMYQPYEFKVEKVNSTVESWPEFCDARNITYRELKLLNPWLRDAQLTNSSGKEYEVKVMVK